MRAVKENTLNSKVTEIILNLSSYCAVYFMTMTDLNFCHKPLKI